jgi:cobalt-zinc-cadmium efflux system membrane fusion protein
MIALRRRRRTRRGNQVSFAIFVLFVVNLSAALLLTSCSRSKSEAEEKPAAESKKKNVVEVGDEALKKSGIVIETAGLAVIRRTLKLNGKIVPNEEQMVQINPRFAGIVKSIAKRLGDEVKKGETIAVIESNESLQSYEVKSEIEGTIIKKDVALGQFVDTSKTIFIIADLRNVWVDFSVYRHESEELRVGQKVLIQSGENAEPIESTISYLSPFGMENTQTTLARAVVTNANGQLRPGLFVDGNVILGETPVKVAVKAAALQTLEDKPVVFVKNAEGFEAREITIGERDDQFVEIKSGVAAGEKYAAENSFLLKSELARPQPGEEE